MVFFSVASSGFVFASAAISGSNIMFIFIDSDYTAPYFRSHPVSWKIHTCLFIRPFHICKSSHATPFLHCFKIALKYMDHIILFSLKNPHKNTGQLPALHIITHIPFLSAPSYTGCNSFSNSYTRSTVSPEYKAISSGDNFPASIILNADCLFSCSTPCSYFS